MVGAWTDLCRWLVMWSVKFHAVSPRGQPASRDVFDSPNEACLIRSETKAACLMPPLSPGPPPGPLSHQPPALTPALPPPLPLPRIHTAPLTWVGG